MVFLAGAWAIVRGVLEIVAAVRLRREIDNVCWADKECAQSVLQQADEVLR